MKLNKIAFGIALAAGVGAAQADEVLFPYVVSGPTVTTILSVANTKATAGNKLHFTWLYKEGAAAGDNAARCEEYNESFSSSPNDLIDLSVDAHFGATTRGVLFESGTVNASYLPLARTVAGLSRLTKPVRAVAIVDNNDTTVGIDNSLVAARATIVEFQSGAAWGYDAFNAKNEAGSYIFDEAAERFGEVFSPVNFETGNASARTPISFKPFNEFDTSFFVTPLFSRAIVAANTLAGGVGGFNNLSAAEKANLKVPTSVAALTALNLTTAGAANTGALTSAVAAGVYGLTLSATNGAPTTTNQALAFRENSLTTRIEASVNESADVAFDRDENPVSGRASQDVTCVGKVSITQLMSTGAQDVLRTTGGWTTLATVYPTTGTNRTPQASVLFLEHNDVPGGGKTIAGVSAGGVINNGYQLRQE